MIAVLHSTVQELRKFETTGWRVPREFNEEPQATLPGTSGSRSGNHTKCYSTIAGLL